MKVSVCMATFNGEQYIQPQIDSILSQLSPQDELIISDDGSTDHTLDIITSYASKDKRIKVLKFSRDKQGQLPVTLATTNFENALRHVNGDYIFLADQDDVWLPEKVATMKKALEKYDYIVSDAYVTDSNLHILSESRFNEAVTKDRWKALFKPTPWTGCCAAFKKNVLMAALPFPSRLQSHDRWIGYIGSLFFKSLIMEQPLIYYRRHHNNTSGSSKSNLTYKINTRIHYIFHLFTRAIARKLHLYISSQC